MDPGNLHVGRTDRHLCEVPEVAGKWDWSPLAKELREFAALVNNPRLHIAAFQGLQDEVKILLDEGLAVAFGPFLLNSILLEEGSTWGSGMTSSISPNQLLLHYYSY